MRRRRSPEAFARAALVVAALVLCSGCRLSRLFDLARDVEIDETHAQSVGLSMQLDLAEATELRAPHPGELASLSLDSADVTVTQVDTAAGENQVQSLSGVLRLRPDGAADASHDVVVGSFAALQLRPGAAAHLPGSPEAGALLLAAHNRQGRFQALLDFDLEGGRSAHLVLWIALHASAGYDAGP